MTFSQQRFDRSDIRQLNTVSVLEQLRTKGPLSRAQIASELGLTRATVSKIASDLLETAFLEETHLTEGGAGRPGMLLDLNAGFGCIVAVEIDLDRVTLAVADFNRTILWREEKPLDRATGADESLEFIASVIDEAMAAGAVRGLGCLGIGVAWAGLVAHETGRLVYGPSSGWRDIPLKARWEDRFGVPVHVENEANSAAIGCQHAEAADSDTDLIYLSVGVGLAAGIISGGRLLRGRNGYAGQVGHVPFADNGITCSCGRAGCWVTEIGSGALLRKLAAKGVDVHGDAAADPLERVYEKAREGGAGVQKALSDIARQVAQGAAQLVQTFNPSTLIVGGHLGKIFRLVEPEIATFLEELTLKRTMENLQFRVSDSGEDPLLGCLSTIHGAIMRSPRDFQPKPLRSAVTGKN